MTHPGKKAEIKPLGYVSIGYVNALREGFQGSVFIHTVQGQHQRPIYDEATILTLQEENERLRKALEPFALISAEGLVADDVYTTVTTVSDYFHAAARLALHSKSTEESK